MTTGIYSGVKRLPDGSLELTCPSCGAVGRLGAAEAAGTNLTHCPGACGFSARVNWLAYLQTHAVRK